MRPESKKYLYDMLRACETLAQFVEGKQFADYDSDLLLRSAVERQLRNVIVHGYTVIENETIWGILKSDVPKLRDQVAQLLG